MYPKLLTHFYLLLNSWPNPLGLQVSYTCWLGCPAARPLASAPPWLLQVPEVTQQGHSTALLLHGESGQQEKVPMASGELSSTWLHGCTTREQEVLQATFTATARTQPWPDRCQEHAQVAGFQRWFSKLCSTSIYSKKSRRQLKDHYPEPDCSNRSVNITQLTHSNITLRQRCEKDKSLSQSKSPKMLNKVLHYFKGLFLKNPLRLLSPSLIK